MKKQGFTLIELLAVIVILAIIAIISVPIITDLINKSRYGAFGVTKKNVEHAAELYYAKNADDVFWENDISYVTIGTLKSKKFLSNNVINTLDSTSINDDTKVLLYRKGRKVDYSLQLYDKQFFDWYQGQMVQASKKEDIALPNTVGETVSIDLEVLIDKGLVDELRLPLELENRCVGYVEIEKTTDNYEYNAYVDCLQGASTFASHYVSYGGKYLDEFYDVKETSDGGYIAVGRSNSEVITKYGTGNNGMYDAIIVKFDASGNVVWSDNFGGSDNEIFRAVVETIDGYIAVGSNSSDDGDITDYKGGTSDGLIVKYNKQGQVVKHRSFGTSNSYEHFMGIDVSGSSVIVFARIGTKNDGDMLDVEGLVRGLEGVVIKFNLDLGVDSLEFFTGYNNEEFNNGIITSDSNYLVTGFSTSKDYDMEGIGYTTEKFQEEGIIVKMSNTGEILAKNSIRGSNQDYLYDVVEVTDGYIAVGYSKSSDQDMVGLSKANNGYHDAIIVKYDKSLENIIWKKSFGGSNDDGFYSVEKVNDNEIYAVGYSKSSDMDMNGIAKSSDGYSNAIIIKYNINNGNVVSKKSFGGTNSEIFSSVIKTTDNEFIIAGSSYSNNLELKNFNKGHQDAVLVGYDSNLNLIKTFQEPVVIIDKIKPIIANYGTNISLKYDHIYTSNDPTKDLLGWCNSNPPYLTGNTSNYYYGTCLKPFNVDDQKLLTALELGYGAKMYAGEYEYSVINQQTNMYNWHLLKVYNSYGTSNLELSNLKLKFSDGYVGYITAAIDNGYIEPLVVVNSYVAESYTYALYPTVIDIINENGRTGVATLPSLYLTFKPKKSRLVSIYLTSSKDYTNLWDGLSIYELRNFDMSITPTE